MELTRRRLLQTGAAAFAGLLVACDDDAASPTTSTARSTSPPSTTGRPPTTSTPATTGATTPPSTSVESIPSGAIEDLRSRLNGTVLTPNDPAYASTALPANSRYAEIRPAVIAQCVDEADVVTSVQWANENGVAPVPRGGGHNYAGLSTTPGLQIDISALNSVTLDPSTGVAVAGGSAHNQDVLDGTINTPFFLPAGTCLGVAVGGLVLGGGIGYNTHWAGLTCDHLVSSRIVVASGEVLEIDASNHPDLFWACRGGTGGTFGLNTSFTFQLVEVPATVTYFRYDFTGSEVAGAMFAEFNRVCAIAPAAFNAAASIRATPVETDDTLEPLSAFFRGQYVGPANELSDLLAPILAVATPTQSALQEMPFWEVQSEIFSAPSPPPHPFSDISRYAREPLPDDTVATVIELLEDCPVRTDEAYGSFWSQAWVGGDVVGSVGRTDTAYVHRDMSTLLRTSVVWEDDDPVSVGDDLMGWADEVVAVIAPHTPNESYQNFPNRSLPDALEQYFAENLDRLMDVKATYDPDNLFSNEQSVPPR